MEALQWKGEMEDALFSANQEMSCAAQDTAKLPTIALPGASAGATYLLLVIGTLITLLSPLDFVFVFKNSKYMY